MHNAPPPAVYSVLFPDGKGGFMPAPGLMTEAELIRFLRIPEVSRATQHTNVVTHLKRNHGLPRVKISGQALYPLQAVLAWLEGRVQV